MSPPLPKQRGMTSPSIVSLQKTCQSQLPNLPSLSLRTPPAGGRGRLVRQVAYFFAYSSAGLSFGLVQASLVASDTGSPMRTLAGGIGCMNHLS